MTADMPNAFTQAKLKRQEGDSRVIVKIAGVLAELLMKKAPHTHEGFVVIEHGKKAMHLNISKKQCMECQKVHHCGTESSEEIWNWQGLHSMHTMHAQQTGV